MKTDKFYLGIDAGGTKTSAILCDLSGSILRTCQLGPGNIAVLDRSAISLLIRNILDELLHGDEISSIVWACCAFAGAGRPEEKANVSELVSTVGLNQFTIMTDAEIRYYSIFGDQSGILVSAGTGSFCIVKTTDQRLLQIGGWGYLLGDEGSGFDIGRHAIKSVLLDHLNNESPSSFSRKLMVFYGLEKQENLVSVIYSSPNPSKLIASCARFVCDQAEAEDPDALKIVEETTSSLVEYALQAVKLISRTPLGNYKVALAGGIFRNNSVVYRKFVEKIKQNDLNFEYVKQDLEPAAGAILYALRQDHQSASENLLNKLYNIIF
jgi:N-acetylglucosamine kinase-like BadF-type ATPase